jgi:hypothetical protein
MQNPLVAYDRELQLYTQVNSLMAYFWVTMCLVKHTMDMHYQPQAIALIW